MDQAQRSTGLPFDFCHARLPPLSVSSVSPWCAPPLSIALSYPAMFAHKPLVSSLGQEEYRTTRPLSRRENHLAAFFGVGRAAQAEEVALQFPDGARQVLRNVGTNQLIVVQEAKGLVAQGAPGAAQRLHIPP
jgi:ASPIC/UnbV protein